MMIFMLDLSASDDISPDVNVPVGGAESISGVFNPLVVG